MRLIYAVLFLFISVYATAQSSRLKYIVYDMDGLDIGETDLPDGDYNNFDLEYEVAANPLAASDVLGDRVLKLNLNWSGGTGAFGKGITKYVELSAASDRFNFYFLNPMSNYASAVVDVSIKEDDNQNGVYESTLDDSWTRSATIPRSANWQLISLPLNTFTDANSGGNGIFDAGYTNNNGKIFTISLTFHQAAAATGPEIYYADMICFSEGALPHGSSILSLPPKAPTDECQLGSYAYRTPADSVPIEVEALFPPGNKLKYINIFMPYAYSGTVPSAFPGSSVQRLLNNGYRPIITWESMFASFPPLDPVQPKLNDITSGSFDSYIDAFANQVKTYSDTIIIRLFHEFDGNWYSWCIEHNGQDPANLIAAYRHIVDRFDALGATKVLWMWCPNSSPAPSAPYNWFVDAYPGNAYVDIVATSIYNHPLSGAPPWRSFRSLLAESYGYMRKYFPSKPFIIAESACRERYTGELSSSQTKAGWICQSAKELKSYFSKTRGLIYFNTNKEHDWRINSSFAAKEAVKNCLWQDPYFNGLTTGLEENANKEGSLKAFPNPFLGEATISISSDKVNKDHRLLIFDITGRKISDMPVKEIIILGSEFLPGIYLLELRGPEFSEKIRLIKQ
jgi:hypothetical protein